MNNFLNALNSFVNSKLATIDKIHPAEVVKVNDNTTVDLKMPIDFLIVDPSNAAESSIERKIKKGVKVFTLKHGVFEIITPLAIGDKGIIIAFDRDCRLFFEGNGGRSTPASLDIHKFDSSFFLPLNFFASSDKIKNNENIIIEKNGKEVLIIDGKEDNIKITSNVEITGNLTIVGGVTAKEDITSDGDIKSGGDVKAGSVSLSNHVHSYVRHPQASIPDNTGKPT